MFDICCRTVYGSETHEISYLHCAAHVKGSGSIENATTIGGEGVQKWCVTIAAIR